MAKSTKALLTGRIQMCKTNPSIAHIGLATHGRSIQIGSSCLRAIHYTAFSAMMSRVLGEHTFGTSLPFDLVDQTAKW
jgi:hypothetical protein